MGQFKQSIQKEDLDKQLSKSWFLPFVYSSMRAAKLNLNSTFSLRQQYISNSSGENKRAQLLAKNPWNSVLPFFSLKDVTTKLKNILPSIHKVDETIVTYNEKSQQCIDWDYWKKRIQHRDIVDRLQKAMTIYEKSIDTTLDTIDVKSEHADIRNHIDLMNYIMINESLVHKKKMEKFIEDGCRILWVSFKNPPLCQIPPDEWLDSDKYWQAYIETHYHFDSGKDIESLQVNTVEDDAYVEANKNATIDTLNAFHDKSEVPVLYEYVDQHHSSSYYKLNRKVFLEHMLYFILRTGNDYKLFPEIPPSDWVVDIERLRYQYLTAANRRRLERQLASMQLNEKLDLCPEDSRLDDAEDHFFNLLFSEASQWKSIVGRLMSDFVFLCYPAIPCQSLEDVNNCLDTYGVNGHFYSLGLDISYMFYLPPNSNKPNSEFQAVELPRPYHAMTRWTAHCLRHSMNLNPGYIHILFIISQLWEKRGQYWLTAHNEPLISAFQRKLSKEDPSYTIFNDYISEFKYRWENAYQLSLDEVHNRVTQLNEKTKIEDLQYQALKQLYSKSDISSSNDNFNSILDKFYKILQTKSNL